jgi:hypothetical protein
VANISPPNADLVSLVRGRFFDPVSGAWQPEADIEQKTAAIRDYPHFSYPAASLDGSGNALVAFALQGFPLSTVASNYYSRSSGAWDQLPPDFVGVLGEVPGSQLEGQTFHPQVAASTDGNFLLAWQREHPENDSAMDLFISRFTSRTRAWSVAQRLASHGPTGDARLIMLLQRIGSDASGNAHVLWTEGEGMHTMLKAIRLDAAGLVCDTAQVIDGPLGRGAARADLAVDPLGDAIAIWQQFEGGRPFAGRSNIAISRFDGATGSWASAVLAETQPGSATSPRASASGGQALLGWIQSEDGANRVKVLLQPFANTAGR